ncbi:MAG: hypothetical protein AABW45_02750 [Nanoarchaeota archaeon]
MNLLQKFALYGLTTASLSVIPSCSEKTNTANSEDKEPNKLEAKNIVFKVLCNQDGLDRGLVVNIAIFDEGTGRREVYGNTGSNGGFCSIVKLDTKKSYRIEFYKYFGNEKKCIGWIKNLTYQQNPIWWADNCDPGYSAAPNIGYRNFGSCGSIQSINDCLGQ